MYLLQESDMIDAMDPWNWLVNAADDLVPPDVTGEARFDARERAMKCLLDSNPAFALQLSESAGHAIEFALEPAFRESVWRHGSNTYVQ